MACASEKMFRMCRRCYAFVSASLDDKCGCASAEHVWFTESQLRCGIHACACGYVGTVSHGCKDGCSRLVAQITDFAAPQSLSDGPTAQRELIRPSDDCMRDEGAVRAQQRERGQPSAVAAACGVAPMLCVDDPCGDDVAEEA